MSFGRKLTLLFIAIVAVPMIAVAVLVVQITRDSRDGKTDASLAAGLSTASSLYAEASRAAPDQAERIAQKAGEALQGGDRARLAAIARDEQRDPAIASVAILDPQGDVIASAGRSDAIAVGESDIRSSDRRLLGTVRVTTLSASSFLADVNRLTGRDAALATDRRVLDSTADLGQADLGGIGTEGVDVDLPSGSLRAAALRLDGAPTGTRLILLAPRESGFVASEPLVAVILVAFFAFALLFIAWLLRSLRRRVGTMLEAAHRIGSGDFAGKVPVEGDDEMAGLAREFNLMSERLGEQMEELRRQRGELDESVRRIGEAFASGLDRKALLEIVAETAISACSAELGRVELHDEGKSPELISTGEPAAELSTVLERASAAALAQRDQGSASEAGCHAIAHAMVGRRSGENVLGTLAVARHGAEFTSSERETLRYLIGQSAVSIENIGLHERVAQQAVTDELTGIPNHRHFSDWVEREASRVDRFGGELSLVLIDLDNFKSVNDGYGHLRGDRVLEELGRILREESRGMDETARYGGEEFVLALPGTPTEAAVQVAERVRRRIESTKMDGEEGEEPITVTASFGVATMPSDATDPRSLISAADAALYRAKRSGKNRVLTASEDAVRVPQGIGRLRRRGSSGSS